MENNKADDNKEQMTFTGVAAVYSVFTVSIILLFIIFYWLMS